MKITNWATEGPEAIEGFLNSILLKDFDDPSPTPNFHRELWALCCADDPLVAIAAPRGHAKSTAVSFVYTLSMVLFRQAEFVLLISDTEYQAQLFLDAIIAALTTNIDLIDLFGVKKLEVANKTDIIVRMNDGHRFRIIAKGSGQRVRGLLWDSKRPDLIIGDDLESDEMVMNDESRKKFLDWVIRALLPCRAPKGKVRIVGTILHLDSFLANVVPLEGGYHTQAEEDGLKFTSRNKRLAWKGMLFKAHRGSLPQEIKSKEDILWGDRFDKLFFEKAYADKLDLGAAEAYSQEYLNRPLDEATAFFRDGDFIAYSGEDRDKFQAMTLPLLHYVGVDTASTGEESKDYTAIVVVGLDNEGFMYVRHVIRERLDSKEIVDALLHVQRNWKPQWIAIEQDKTGKSILPFLKERMMTTGVFINIVPIIPHADKIARAQSIQGRMRLKTVKFDKQADYWPMLEHEMKNFPRGKHDDQVDALSCIGLGLARMAYASTHAEEQQEQRESVYEEALAGGYDGRSTDTGY